MTRLNRKTWNQFISLSVPYWRSDQKWAPIGLTGLLFVLLLAYTRFAVAFNQLYGEFASSLATQDSDRFWSGMRLFLILLIVAVPTNAFYYYVRDKLAISWRRWLTDQFLGDYFANCAYYDLTSHPTIDNPDQRISEDINTFTQKTLQLLLIFVNAIMQLVAFSWVLWSISRVLVAFLLIYAVIGTLFTILVFGRGMTVLNYLQLKREADFRFGLVRVRENAESIAFYQGEDQEKSLVRHRFEQAFINFNKLIWWQLFLSMFQYGNSYAACLLPYVILAPAILVGELEAGTVQVAAGAFAACLTALNLVIDNFDSVSKFAAGIDRLDSFKKAIKTAAAEAASSERIEQKEGDELKLTHVTLQIPHKPRILVKDVSLTVSSGSHLVISGPSGCGKTSLLRAIMGLWNHGSGTIERPPLDEILFLPQRPYMILGSLRHQLLYPRLDADVSDQDLNRVLDLVNLHHLAERDHSLDAEADWSKVLSVGEQQRLSFARLFLMKPKYAFLDEATSALDLDSEAHLYRELRESDTTVISVSHHASIRGFHKSELELLGEGEWKLQSVAETESTEPTLPPHRCTSIA